MKAAEVIIYVEGRSDRLSMEALLEQLIKEKRQKGVNINFHEAQNGDKKQAILTKIPIKAVSILKNRPNSVVVAMPDLYPKNKGFKHETVDELKSGITKRFSDTLQSKGIKDHIISERFKVFCFKYDLEALILASEEALKKRLGIKYLDIKWQKQVEDQNHDTPPKHIVRRLFEEQNEYYNETVDAPFILGSSNYKEIADRCPQCFKPFVEFLTDLQPAG